MRVGLVVVVLLVSGCCTPPLRPSEVPVGAPSEGGIGDRVVQVLVTSPEEPVADVPVMLFWVPPERPQTDGRTNLVALGLRTSASGTVVGKVPGNAVIHVAAGAGVPGDFEGLHGWTEEWRLDAVPADGKDATISLPVYPRSLKVAANGTWTTASATTYYDAGYGPVPWLPVDVLPGGTDAARQGFADRLVRVNATLAWTNEGTNLADFALTAYHANVDGAYCLVANEHQTAAVGNLSEQLDTSRFPDSLACGWALPSPTNGTGLLLGPAAGRIAVAPLGAAFDIEATLYFGYPSSFEELCGRMAGEYQMGSPGTPTGGPRSPSETANEDDSSAEYRVQFQDPDSGELSEPQNRTARDVDTPAPGAFAVGALVVLLALAVRRRR